MLSKILTLLLFLYLALLPSLFSQTGEQLRANLYAFNTDSSLSLNDGNLTMYNISNSNAVDKMDAVKMTNFGENFGLLRGNTTLAVERRQSMTKADTIFFRMWNMRQKSYKIALSLTGLDHPGLKGVLEDKYLKTSTALNLNGANSAIFTITNDLASSASNRFSIIFLQEASSFTILPITFTAIKACHDNLLFGRAGKNIDVEWSVANEKDIVQYRVQRSMNGQQFLTLSAIYLNGKTLAHYKWTDISSLIGNNFYRIGTTDINGKIQYSNVTMVSAAVKDHSFSIYPNPVMNGSINVLITDRPKGMYTTRLINQNGQVVVLKQIHHNGGNSSQTMQAGSNKGNYILEIVTPDKSIIKSDILVY